MLLTGIIFFIMHHYYSKLPLMAIYDYQKWVSKYLYVFLKMIYYVKSFPHFRAFYLYSLKCEAKKIKLMMNLVLNRIITLTKILHTFILI